MGERGESFSEAASSHGGTTMPKLTGARAGSCLTDSGRTSPSERDSSGGVAEPMSGEGIESQSSRPG
eukprot:scaffold20225_cov121-Isochrysis_galbana.AAC.5